MIAGRIGQKISFIMGGLFLIEALIRISYSFLFYPDTPLLLVCGILAIVGVLLGLKGYKYGRFLCLIAGILAFMGFLIFYYNFGFRFVLIAIVAIFPHPFFPALINFISPFIFLFGGVLCVISEENFLSYSQELDYNPIQRKRINILFCPDCGEKVLPTAKFCIICGKQFNG